MPLRRPGRRRGTEQVEGGSGSTDLAQWEMGDLTAPEPTAGPPEPSDAALVTAAMGSMSASVDESVVEARTSVPTLSPPSHPWPEPGANGTPHGNGAVHTPDRGRDDRIGIRADDGTDRRSGATAPPWAPSSAPSSAPFVAVGAVQRVVRPLAIDAAARIAGFLVMYAIAVAEQVPVGGLLRQWDGRWFLLAARSGYPSAVPPGFGDSAQSTLGFFPGFPLVIRATVAVTGLGYEAAALLAVWVLGLVASVLIWRLLYDHHGARAADLGTAFVVFSPAAFVLGMVYSEALLLAAAAGCLVALRRERWVVAGLCAAVATATDPLGAAAVVPCLVAAVAAVRATRRLRPLIAPMLAPTGIVAFFSYLWVHTGSPLSYYTAQRRGWQGGTLGTGLVSPFDFLVTHGLQDVDEVVKAVSTLAVAVLLIVVLRHRQRPDGPVLGYTLAALALAALSPIITWTPRVALRAFPILAFPLARLRAPWSIILLGTSATLMCVLSVLTVAGHAPFTP
jgi:hypothetical protein